MIELLGTYTEDNASQARDDAQKYVVVHSNIVCFIISQGFSFFMLILYMSCYYTHLKKYNFLRWNHYFRNSLKSVHYCRSVLIKWYVIKNIFRLLISLPTVIQPSGYVIMLVLCLHSNGSLICFLYVKIEYAS